MSKKKKYHTPIIEESDDFFDTLECDSSSCIHCVSGVCIMNNWECRVRLDNGDNGVYRQEGI